MINKRDSGTISPWQVSVKQLHNYNQTAETIYDVIIVGAGITGITTALLLQQEGKNCLLLEGHVIGYGTTGGTTAHINTFFDSTYPEIDSDFGKEASKLVANAGKKAIELINTMIDKYQIECDFELKSGLLYSADEKETKQLAEILDSSLEAGVAVKKATNNNLPIPFDDVLEFEHQAQFHPLKYIYALAKEYLALGGQLIENAFVSDLTTNNNIHTVTTKETKFSAANVVYATHLPPGINQLSFRCAPYRSYVLGIKLNIEQQYPASLVYDMQEPYHYFRTHVINAEKLLILGGADHKTAHEDPLESYNDLIDYAHKYFDIDKIEYQWSSQYYVPVDGLPYIGPMTPSDETIFVATGFNGNGMTWGTISGKLIADLILGKENTYAELFKPYRIKPIAGFTEFVKENADVAYHFIADRFHNEEIDKLSDLKRGEGKVIEFKGENVAVYKDNNGLLTALHPTCTHAGCTVKFNKEEKSWDCPCHGGRYDLEGNVIAGPPQKNLPPVELG